MRIFLTICQVGRSQNKVLGSYIYILGPMSSGKVPEYSTGSNVYILGPMSGVKVPECSIGVLCIYPGPYVSLEGSRVYFWVPMYISWALCQVRRYESIVLGCYV